jgi:NAD(P)H-dependent FMN reductase
MLTIPIILGSTRRGRQSPKVARFLHQRLQAAGVQSELLDLADYDFPIMEERLSKRDDPPPRLREFAAKVAAADALCIVTPEYNNGIPGVLKNALDYLWPEYARKPFGIATVSSGGFGGLYALSALRQVVIGLRGFTIPAAFPVSNVEKAFPDDGSPADASLEKRADKFLAELIWFAEAIQARKQKDAPAA